MSFLRPELCIDGYKIDHRRQYPKGTELVYSNWTPRSSRIKDQKEVIFFGLQYFLARYLMDEFQTKFFDMPFPDIGKRYLDRVNGYLGPNEVGIQHIKELHDLGYLPLIFKALPEGTSVPLRVPMLTIENTLGYFGWLTNYFETLMSCVLWLPCTSATTASRMRKLFHNAAIKTGSPLGGTQWQGHDFSMRGMEGPEAAALSGAGHLLFFTGTDTLPALDLIDEYYNPPEGYFVGGSIPATEHSVMCAGGEESELDTFNRLLDLYSSGLLAVVSDTWDLWKVLTNILPALKDRIMGRDGKLVIRPDSGDPVKIICGDPDAPEGSPASKGTIRLLYEVFGGTLTPTGHKMLDSHIGCIYGDGITYERAQEIMERLDANGFASGSVVLGIGSFNYQYVTRDTFGFAMKATHVTINGKGLNIFKKPVTDDGIKNSAKGRLAVIRNNGTLELISEATPEQEASSELKPVWKDGAFLKVESYDIIRNRALSSI
jgi:nicotinamide phosphoribosyltransferase